MKRFETEKEAVAHAKRLAKRSRLVECTGDVVCGDEIIFVRGNWERVPINRFGKLAWRFTSYDVVRAKVVNDSYGAKKQQHTFTLRLRSGEKILIKGRNLYRFIVFRKKWKKEDDRKMALLEKHRRGKAARSARNNRITYSLVDQINDLELYSNDGYDDYGYS